MASALHSAGDSCPRGEPSSIGTSTRSEVPLPAGLATLDEAPSRRAPESPWLERDFVESYARWREESAAVRDAYDSWSSAEPRDRALAWSAYRAAIDREEHAANAYRVSAEWIAGP